MGFPSFFLALPILQADNRPYKPGFAGIQTTSASHTGVALSWSKIARLGVEHGWKSSFFMC